MKLLFGIIFGAFIATLTRVLAVEDRHRRRHGHGHSHRRTHHSRHHSDKEEEDDDKDWKDVGEQGYGVHDGNDYGGLVHKNCKRTGMVALTFDDGVV